MARSVAISNPDKVLYPGNGFTKARVIEYYQKVSPWLVPHLKNRPVTLKRYPDGVSGQFFYEKNAPKFTPDWVKTFEVDRESEPGKIRYILINDRATLEWCANLASLELHPFLHRAPKLDRPTSVVFDLDPGEGADVLACAAVALQIRDLLAGAGIECFPKVSGSKGIQLHVPLNTPTSYEITSPFAHTLARLLEEQQPGRVISKMAKKDRQGKVFIDWSQNSRHKTTVSVYSLRAKHDVPYVSMPVAWDELENALRAGKPDRLFFSPEAALKRLEKSGDLYKPVIEKKQKLPAELVREIQRSQGAGVLAEYRRKRDFAITAEPAPAEPQPGAGRRFVIQKHDASHLHYDFRLEMDGVLKSWAVPKGPPYQVRETRLAMATEDHPLEYLGFEGTIPEGQYGGGTVMVWDIGTYELMDGSYPQGKLHLCLHGKKLKGEWIVVRQKGSGKNWFLIKAGEAMEPPSARREDRSALTRRSMQRIARDNDAVWQSNRGTPARKSARPPRTRRAASATTKADSDEPAAYLEPMLAKPAAALPEGDGWRYELKFDGIRALAVKSGGSVKLYSRNRNTLNGRFPSLVEALGRLAGETVVDGEVVALDAEGRPSFSVLQNRRTGNPRIFYYAFDLPHWNGRNLIHLPLDERRRLLSQALRDIPEPVRFSQTLDAPAGELLESVRSQGLEGVVAKQAASGYESGRRTGAWIKVRANQSRELVIGGYTPGSHGFDALVVGYWKASRLNFAGKVRNGFVPTLRRDVARMFRGRGTTVCPFDNLPVEAGKRCCWLRPELTARIEFANWTDAGHLRHARFAGFSSKPTE